MFVTMLEITSWEMYMLNSSTKKMLYEPKMDSIIDSTPVKTKEDIASLLLDSIWS